MKTRPYLLWLIAIALCLQHCSDEPELNETIAFSIPPSAADIPDDAKLLVSLESNGTTDLILEELSLSYDGQRYISSPLKLPRASYTIREFLVIDESDNVVYSHAPVAALNFSVSTSGPHEIYVDIGNDITRQLSDQRCTNLRNTFLLWVTGDKPFYEKGCGTRAYVLSGTDTIGRYQIPPYPVRISIKGSTEQTYSLIIEKADYATVTENFVLRDWTRLYQKKPHIISLKPAFTMAAVIEYTGPEWPFNFYLDGKDGTLLTVNWGDGAIESYTLAGYHTECSHIYANVGSYPIDLTGQLENITYFYSFYGGSVFSEISFKRLPNLSEIRYGLTAGPAVVDLRFNQKLEFAMLSNLMDMETLLLPNRHSLTYIDICGPNKLTTADVDAIIDNIYRNVIRQNIRDGGIGLHATWYADEGDYSLVGPPSAESMIKLQYLIDNYGWDYYPRPGNSFRSIQQIQAMQARR